MHEVAPCGTLDHAIDEIAGNRPDAAFEHRDALPREPSLRDLAIAWMIGSVHLQERPHQMRAAAGQTTRQRICSLGYQRASTLSTVEEIVPPAHLDDIGIGGHSPEGV